MNYKNKESDDTKILNFVMEHDMDINCSRDIFFCYIMRFLLYCRK